MAFTEFYCNSSTGSNANGGSDDGSPSFTDASGSWNGTSVITTAVSTSGVVVGQFCNVNNGAYVARVTAKTATTITLSTTAFSGSAPGSGTYNCVIGGVWKGPNGASGFPLTFVTGALTDASTNRPRINLKNNADYSVTAAMVGATTSAILFQGYTTSPGDGGKAIIDGGTSGTSYIVYTVGNGQGLELIDLIFQNNGASGSANGVVGANTASQAAFYRCVFANMRGCGFSASANTNCKIVECEAYGNNQSSTANLGGFRIGTSTLALRCKSHDNTGSNTSGFICVTNAVFGTFVDCVSDSNGQYGFACIGGERLIRCDAYNNGSDGINFNSVSGTTDFYIENCNLVKNGGYGINCVSAGTIVGIIQNCGFGSGTKANSSGTTNISVGSDAIQELGSVTYASGVLPWVDPDNGDFRINLAAAKGAGRGAFTATAAGYGGTIGYPDIGAAQHQDAGGGGAPSFGSRGPLFGGRA